MFFNKKISIYLFLSLTLFLGFFLGENSSGGAKIDHEYLFPFIKNFSLNFETGFESFMNNSGSLLHSPTFYIIISFFLKIFENLLIVNVLYLLVSLYLPLLFYQILKEKFKTENFIIFILSVVIFFSPYFRSSAIWLLGDNLSLIFFGISILFFLKFDHNKKKNKFAYLSIGFLIACCYIRYYYCIFYLYFLYYFLKHLDIKFVLKIVFFSFFLSIPAISYLYYIITKFNFLEILNNFGSLNYFNSSLTILSILLFYLFPFIIDKDRTIFKYYRENISRIFYFSIAFIFIFFIQYFFINELLDFPQRGGGIFIKLFRFLNINETISMLFVSCVSLIIIDFLFKEDRFLNYFLLLVLIISLPLTTIYQKYLDPLFYLIFLGLVKSDYLKNRILTNNLNLKFILSYFLSFYLFSLLYYLS